MARTKRTDLSKVSKKGKNFRSPAIVGKIKKDKSILVDLRKDPDMIGFSIKIRNVIKKYAGDDFKISALAEKVK